MSQEIPENQQAAETTETNLDSQFPLEKFDRRVQWTKAGSPEGLSESVVEVARECSMGNPKVGVIEFRKLPDGGYEIKSFKSRE